MPSLGIPKYLDRSIAGNLESLVAFQSLLVPNLFGGKEIRTHLRVSHVSHLYDIIFLEKEASAEKDMTSF